MIERIMKWCSAHAASLFALLMVVVFIVGAKLMLVQSGFFDVHPEFFHLLGHAFVVAAILGLTVDVFLKARLMREITHGVARYLIGYELPPEIRERIHDLMKTERVYRNFEIRCHLSEKQDKPGFALLDFTLSNDVDNITNQPLAFVDQLEYEKQEPTIVLEMRCDSLDTKANYRKSGSDLGKDKQDDPGAKVAVGNKVKILPHNRERQFIYRFAARYQTEYSIIDSEIISFANASFGATVICEMPDNYDVTLSPMPDAHNVDRWSYNRLFLPGEYIRIRWARRAEGPVQLPLEVEARPVE